MRGGAVRQIPLAKCLCAVYNNFGYLCISHKKRLKEAFL